MIKFPYNIQNIINLNLIIFVIAQILGNFFVNLSIVLFSLLLFFCFFNDKNFFLKRINSKPILILTIFFISIIAISLIINKDLKDFGLIRFYFFCLSFYFFSNEIVKCFKKYYVLFFLIIFIVSFDSIIQYFSGTNLLGMKLYQGNATGLFGDEQIIGSFISKFLILIIPFAFKSKKTNIERYYLMLFFVFSFLTIILSGERRALIDISIFLILFLIINFKYINFKYILSLIIVLILFSGPINKNFLKPIQFQLGLVDGGDISKENMDKYGVQFKPSITNNVYYAHYMTALNIWSDNILFGTGNKGFRKNCRLKKYDNLQNEYFKLRCSTHPHNIHLQILSEFGLINFLIFIYICLLAIFKNFKDKIGSDLMPFLIYFIIILAPLPSGAILSTSFGSYFWGIFGILLNEKNFNKK